MKRFRCRRLKNRLSFLAMFVLLWSQLALASHPACSLSSMQLEQQHPAVQAPCHDAGGERAPYHPAGQPVCDSHCSRSDLSSDTARVLAVPALAALPAIPVAAVVHLPNPGHAQPSPAPLGAWHRPTLHPASLLLI